MKKNFKNHVKTDWLYFDLNEVRSMQGQNFN